MLVTESEWLAATDPEPMLKFLHGKTSERKLRLFIVAYCRPILEFLPTNSRLATEVSERYADGLTIAVDLRVASDLADTTARVTFRGGRPTAAECAAAAAADCSSEYAGSIVPALSASSTAAGAVGCAAAGASGDGYYGTSYEAARSRKREE
jgi:hypothetical protein